MMYTCPVCGYDKLREPPEERLFNICPSCGTEFGYHDSKRTYEELRERWLAAGAKWHSKVVASPPNWDPWQQLGNIGVLL